MVAFSVVRMVESGRTPSYAIRVPAIASVISPADVFVRRNYAFETQIGAFEIWKLRTERESLLRTKAARRGTTRDFGTLR